VLACPTRLLLLLLVQARRRGRRLPMRLLLLLVVVRGVRVSLWSHWGICGPAPACGRA
jgi:hypothetical protein